MPIQRIDDRVFRLDQDVRVTFERVRRHMGEDVLERDRVEAELQATSRKGMAKVMEAQVFQTRSPTDVGPKDTQLVVRQPIFSLHCSAACRARPQRSPLQSKLLTLRIIRIEVHWDM